MAQPGAPRALIFDMDGTLVNSMPLHARSWALFAQQHGLRIDLPDVLARTTGRTGAECMRELFQQNLDDARAWTLIRQKEAIYRDLAAHALTEVSGASAFVRAARTRGWHVGLGTAGDATNIAFTLQRLALDTPFDAMVGGDEGLPGKPEPAIFLEAARRLGVAPRRCVVFEDAPLGIAAAGRAGMRAVGITTSYTPDQLAGAHVLTHAPDFDHLLTLTPPFLESLDAIL